MAYYDMCGFSVDLPLIITKMYVLCPLTSTPTLSPLMHYTKTHQNYTVCCFPNILDKMKPAVTAKLAHQCSDLYAEAMKLLQLDSIRGLWPKVSTKWWRILFVVVCH